MLYNVNMMKKTNTLEITMNTKESMNMPAFTSSPTKKQYKEMDNREAMQKEFAEYIYNGEQHTKENCENKHAELKNIYGIK